MPVGTSCGRSAPKLGAGGARPAIR